jgi:L-alanine-DL-glutamate epimerase-like enolase superfamily enzyme
MLQVAHYSFELEFEYPFTIAKGTKTHQPTLITSLGLGNLRGYGEAPAINYYNVTVAGMAEVLESKKRDIERYALTDPQRFWHFLHHLIPGEDFLICALDMAGWELFAQMRRMPLYQLLRLNFTKPAFTDYTLGIDSAEKMIAKMEAHPWPVYKVKLGKADDIDLLRALRAKTEAPFRVDVNEGWNFEDTKLLLPELKKLGVTLVEQPLKKNAWAEMEEL